MRGFIVHIGTSDSGHYYSLIKDGNKWIKFDDSRVEEWAWATSSRDKDNAYLLIYEKVEKNLVPVPQPVAVGNTELMEKVQTDNQLLVKETLFLQKAFSTYLVQTLAKLKIPT